MISDTETLNFHVDGPNEQTVSTEQVVFIGSLGSDVSMWDPQVEAMRVRHRVVCIDLPGHGGSPAWTGSRSIEQMARQLAATLDQIGGARVHLVGLSLGGMLAMALGASGDPRLASITVACSSSYLGATDDWLSRADAVRAGGTEAVADAVVGRWFTARFAHTHPEVVTKTRAMISAVSSSAYAGCCDAIADLDLREALPRIQVPTLVIAGDTDPSTPVAHSEVIVEGVPNSRLLVLPAAHLANVESPRRFTQAVEELVSDADRDGPGQ